MLAGALLLTACSHNSSLPPFTASGFAEDQGAVRIWRKDSGDNVHLLAVFSPWRSGDTTTREYRWQGDNLTLININVYSKPPVNIRARFDDRGDLSFMQRESDGEKQQLSNDQIDLYRYRADQLLLGVAVIIVTGIPLIIADKLIGGGDGTAGIAASSSAGAAVATPVLIAEMVPAFKPMAPAATSLVATAVIVTSILVPILTSIWSRKVKARAAKIEILGTVK